jgi:PAS domain S-box-containing protein
LTLNEEILMKKKLRTINSFYAIFAIAIFAIVFIPLFSCFYFYPKFENTFVQSKKNEAVKVADYLGSTVIPNVKALTTSDFNADFENSIVKIKSSLGIMKIKIFSPSGETVYSTDHQDIGSFHREAYNVIRKGNYAAFATKHQKSLEGDVVEVDVVETYAPILRDRKLIGIFEIYLDVTAERKSLRDMFWRANIVIVSFAGCLFFAVLISAVLALRAIKKENLAHQLHIESLQRFEDLVNSTDGVVWEADAKTFQFTFVNKKAKEMLGYELDEWFQPGFWAEHLHPEDKEWAIDYCISCTKALRSHKFEYRFIAKDGRVVWLRDIVTVLHENEEPTILRGLMIDITEQKSVEDELKRYQQRLEELNATLEDRVRQEVNKNIEKDRIMMHQSRLAAMGEMIGAIAHQWRQPLNAVGLIVQNIKDAYDFNELDKKYLTVSVEKAMQQIEFMSKTIDDFRHFFKPSKERTEFAVCEALRDVVSMIQTQFEANGISIVYDCERGDAEKVISIWGYPNEFKHVILNIFSNAKDAIMDAREKGKMPDSEQGLITVHMDRSEDKFSIFIEDNAGGMPDEILSRVFEPYFTTKEQGKGTGMGLHMAKTIIEQHMGGTLTARNTEKGAGFIIEMSINERS